MPPDAHALFHHDRLRFGLGRLLVEDTPGWQGAIEYLDTDSPRDTAELLAKLGVTHALWTLHQNNSSRADAAREAVFARTLAEYVLEDNVIDGWHVGALRNRPKDFASATSRTTIAWLVCDADAKPGIYSPKGLATGNPQKPLPLVLRGASLLNELSSANVAITKASCPAAASAIGDLPQEFAQVTQLGNLTVWTRTRPD